MTKIAFLFLTRGEHNNISLWEQFFQGAASPDQYKIVIHAKTPEQLRSPLWHNNVINNIPTAWGTISLVKATVFLLQCAVADPLVTRFVLLSESCLPTTNFDKVYAHLMEQPEKSYIHYTMGKNLDRYNMVKAYLPPKLTPNLWAKQSQWMCLGRRHVQMLFAPPFQTYMFQWLNDFKFCPVPDEHFFINFYLYVCRLPESDFINSPMTYVEWPARSKHPKAYAYLPRNVIDLCRAKHIMFARKFYPLNFLAAEVAYLFPSPPPPPTPPPATENPMEFLESVAPAELLESVVTPQQQQQQQQQILIDYFGNDPLSAILGLTATQLAQMCQIITTNKHNEDDEDEDDDNEEEKTKQPP